MKLAPLFVKRPVTTSMVYLGIFLFGALAWIRLPQELFPNISVPQLVVVTQYANVGPEDIENNITKPIEEAVGTVANLRRVSSVSKEGLSAVTLYFNWGTDMDFAHLATREKLDRMKDQLPPEADEPIIKRVNPFAKPIVIISFSGDMPLADMTELSEDVIKTKLEKTEGVAAITISGGQEREILIEVDRGRLDASQVSLPMVLEAVKNANYDYPAGTTQGKVFEYLVRTQGRFTKVEDIQKTIVKVENTELDPIYKWKTRETHSNERQAPREQKLIPLSYLATVAEGLQDRTSYSRFNGRENISISIQKQAESNTVAVAKAVQRSLDELRLSLPKSLRLEIVYNEAEYIKTALSNMRNNVLIGGILAFFVLFYFLGNFRDAINMGIAIPMSILASLIMMDMFGLSLNILTLAGLALTVGNLTDCATVVTENIVRHHKVLKKPLMQAAMDGADEMNTSMLSATMTNIAVFLPLLFITGVAQKLFQGLFVVTVFTNLAGLFVALTLIPRMAAHNWTLPAAFKADSLKRFSISNEKQARMDNYYQRKLDAVLKKPFELWLPLILAGGLSIFVTVWLPKVFMPKIDQGQFFIELDMPVGTRLDISNHIAGKLEGLLSQFPGVDVMVSVGSSQNDEELEALEPHQARLVVTRTKKSKESTDEIISRFKKMVEHENLEGGYLTYTLQDSPLRTALAGGAPVEVEIKGPHMDELRNISKLIENKFNSTPYLYSVKSTYALPSRETQVSVDKDRAAGFQLSVYDIARTALIAIRGVVATTFKQGGKETDIRVRLREADRHDSSSIRQLALRSPRGMMVPLQSVAQIKQGTGASEIRHLDQQRAVVVTAEVSGKSIDMALEEVQKMLGEFRAYKDVTVQLGGESQRRSESFSSLKYTLLLALVLVFMIMAAEFESLTQPLIIMFTVPFSFIGVAFTLFLTNTPFSSVVVLGVIILAGMVVNNGIVLIDHINNLRKEGMNLDDAIRSGAADRLRPILLTTITTILAVMPLAVGLGRGDELAQPLAVVTFGGMFVSTLLTLLAVPVLYRKFALMKGER